MTLHKANLQETLGSALKVPPVNNTIKQTYKMHPRASQSFFCAYRGRLIAPSIGVSKNEIEIV